jgi:23S rRNA pseudouridine2605 synthase
LVIAGRVRVNGRVCKDGTRRIDPVRDAVVLDDRPVRLPHPARDLVWWMVNKPRGVVATTQDPEGRETVLDLVPRPRAPGLAPVGRLDKASAGLLLLTNDNVLAARLLAPASHVEKTYRVKVRGHPSAAVLHAWTSQTREIDGLALGPMAVAVEREGPRSTWLLIRLAEGKNRQIRRRCGADGHAVEVLVRVGFGPLALGDLAAGAARLLSRAERKLLAEATTP